MHPDNTTGRIPGIRRQRLCCARRHFSRSLWFVRPIHDTSHAAPHQCDGRSRVGNCDAGRGGGAFPDGSVLFTRDGHASIYRAPRADFDRRTPATDDVATRCLWTARELAAEFGERVNRRGLHTYQAVGRHKVTCYEDKCCYPRMNDH